jgi:5-methylcytosine-specific restriction protein A
MKTPRLKTLRPRIENGKLQKVATTQLGQRLTGSKWIGVKKLFERHNPRVCAECDRQGLVGNGDELDHIVPLWAGGGNNQSNLQWLCRDHHKEKTKKEATVRSNT